MTIQRLILCLAVLFALPSMATADKASGTLTLDDYLKYGKDAGETTTTYLSGLRDGILLYDTYAAKYLKAEKHICSNGAALDTDRFVKVLDAQIEKGGAGGKAWPRDIPLQVVAIYALLKAYPCQ